LELLFTGIHGREAFAFKTLEISKTIRRRGITRSSLPLPDHDVNQPAD